MAWRWKLCGFYDKYNCGLLMKSVNSFENSPGKYEVSLCIHWRHSYLLLSHGDISFMDILKVFMNKEDKV
jgi:hypothetical protein